MEDLFHSLDISPLILIRSHISRLLKVGNYSCRIHFAEKLGSKYLALYKFNLPFEVKFEMQIEISKNCGRDV